MPGIEEDIRHSIESAEEERLCQMIQIVELHQLRYSRYPAVAHWLETGKAY